MVEFDTIISIRQYLKDELEMDTKDIDDMVEILLESLTNQIVDLKAIISFGDLTEIRDIGHAIKGAAANMGAVHISEIGKKLESPEINSDPIKCSEIMAILQEALTFLQN